MQTKDPNATMWAAIATRRSSTVDTPLSLEHAYDHAAFCISAFSGHRYPVPALFQGIAPALPLEVATKS